MKHIQDHSVRRLIAFSIERRYSDPLVLYGDRTRVAGLLAELRDAYRHRMPEAEIVTLNGERFPEELIFALCSGTGESGILDRYRHCDVLIFDWFERIAGKDTVMRLAYRLTDYFLEHGKRIAFGLLAAPRDIPALWPRIRAQLEGGLLCNVDGEG